jgi:hypothetical protein
MTLTKEHFLGFVIGILTPAVCLPFVLWIMALSFSYDFEFFWEQFITDARYTSKYLSLSFIPNLFWFYFFLNREQYEVTRGIILATLSMVPYAIYVNIF